MSKQQNKTKMPSISEFYVNTALYTVFETKDAEGISAARGIIFTSDTIDCFCIECSTHSVFKPSNNIPKSAPSQQGGREYLGGQPSIYQKEFNCSRNPSHQLNFFIKWKDGLLSKVGQTPALADIAEQDVKKYRNILGETFYNELSKAVGLYAHGIGVGAFVYLRRIIENFIITPAYEEANKSPQWDDKIYQKSRIGEKITLLKDHLPDFLVQNKSIYGIISKGLHELTEEECKEYFPTLKTCLEFILTELATKKETEQKKREMQLALATIVNKGNQ